MLHLLKSASGQQRQSVMAPRGRITAAADISTLSSAPSVPCCQECRLMGLFDSGL